MDAAAWAFGQTPMSCKPLPSSFAAFFPTFAFANRPTPTDLQTTAGTVPRNINWTKNLSVPQVRFQPPAWERVAAEPHPSTGITSTIMKRVGFPSRQMIRKNMACRVASSDALFPELDQDLEQELGPKKRQRTDSCASIDGELDLEHHVGGAPLSEDDVRDIMENAMVDVANCIMTHRTATSLQDYRDARSGHYMKASRTKRRFNIELLPRTNGGNPLRTYLDIIPIVDKVAESGFEKIDITTARILRDAAIRHGTKRNARRQGNAYAAPELSDITDITEPEASIALMKPPMAKAAATSPTKKFAKLPSPVDKSPTRIADTKVMLLPASSPRIEPSPTKSASAPSTPFRTTPQQKLQTPSAITPSAFTASAISAREQLSPLYESPGPSRVFKAPSYSELSSSNVSAATISTEASSPAKYARPGAPTPSQWSRRDPTTPFRASLSSLAGSAQIESPAGIMLSVSRPAPLSILVPETPQSLQFDFGTTTSFTSISWLNSSTTDADVERLKKANKRRRRQSEPLTKGHVRSKARRQTLSPRKLLGAQETDTTFLSGASFTPLRHSTVAGIIRNSFSSPAKASTDRTPTARVHFADEEEVTSTRPLETTAEKHNSTPSSQGVLNIDVRQNPDIFGSHAPSSISRPPAISRLADIAEDGCDGQAKVVVTEENDRLFVRFKLPATYASMFPQSQGADESRFTTSPSMISLSPRINFKGHYQPVADVRELGSSPMQHFISADVLATPVADHDYTLSIPDFAPSPIVTRPTQNSPVKLLPTASSPSLSQHQEDLDDLEGASMISFPSAIIEDCDTTIPGLEVTFEQMAQTSPAQGDNAQSSPLKKKVTGSESVTPLRQTPAQELPGSTPAFGGLGIFGNWSQASLGTPLNGPISTPTNFNITPAQPFEAQSAASTPLSATDAGDCAVAASSDGQEVAQQATHGIEQSTPLATAPRSTSFTPVNKPSPQGGKVGSNSQVGSDKPVEAIPSVANPRVYDDGSDREYLQQFLKRNMKKRLSTTEAGSPIANPARRQPLGVKSPNTESPHKAKRKLDDESRDGRSPIPKRTEPEPKRAKRAPKGTGRKATVREPEDEPTITIQVETASAAAASANEDADDADLQNASSTRRSTRLKSQGKEAAPKSLLPTPIKLNRSAGRGLTTTLNSSVRTEQQDLTYQTRANTRKNKGNAEYPAQFLARNPTGPPQEESSDEPWDDNVQPAKDGKYVGWKNPLAAYQEEQSEKPKKGKTGPKPKTYGTSGIAKPSKVTSADQRERAVKRAQSLGMVRNGTPAKARPQPQRVTRSRAQPRV